VVILSGVISARLREMPPTIKGVESMAYFMNDFADIMVASRENDRRARWDIGVARIDIVSALRIGVVLSLECSRIYKVMEANPVGIDATEPIKV
jgi:hypothetical protein